MTHRCADVVLVTIDGQAAQHCRVCGYLVCVYAPDEADR